MISDKVRADRIRDSYYDEAPEVPEYTLDEQWKRVLEQAQRTLLREMLADPDTEVGNG